MWIDDKKESERYMRALEKGVVAYFEAIKKEYPEITGDTIISTGARHHIFMAGQFATTQWLKENLPKDSDLYKKIK